MESSTYFTARQSQTNQYHGESQIESELFFHVHRLEADFPSGIRRVIKGVINLLGPSVSSVEGMLSGLGHEYEYSTVCVVGGFDDRLDEFSRVPCAQRLVMVHALLLVRLHQISSIDHSSARLRPW